MKAQELLRAQFEMAHQFMEMTIADCSQETLDKKPDEWTINPVGALYAHTVIAEDAMVNGMARGKQPLLERDGWAEKLGIDGSSPMQDEHYSELKINLPAMREFAAAVAKETDEFLTNASEDELMKEIDALGQKTPAIMFLANIGLTHVAGHWGEIAALKGVQGLKGLPF